MEVVVLKMLPLALSLSLGSGIPAAVVAGLALHQPAQMPSTHPTLSVAGDAQLKVVPDTATFQVVVDASDADKTKAQQAAQRRTAAVIEAATRAGIGPAGVRVTSVSLTPVYETDRQGQPLYLRVRTWTATRSLTLCVDDLSKMNAIFGAVIDAGGSVQGDVTFDTSRLEELREKARRLAAEAARKKATVLVDALGGRVGMPQSISEGEPAWSGPVSYKNAVESWRNGAFVDGAFAPGQMTVRAHVDVVFAIDG